MNPSCSTDTEVNVKNVWVIKDEQDQFTLKNSIGKNVHSWLYIASKTFSEECWGYTKKERAEEVLAKLNKMKTIAEFDITFHLEYLNLEKIINDHKVFQGENLVICEKILTSIPLIEAI